MCTDVAKEQKKKERNASGSGSPKADVQAQQRKRILSPKRQRYESEFEKYVEKKLVTSKLEDQPPPDMNFDTTTKPTGSINQKVIKKLKFEKETKKKQKEDQLLKSLPTLEKEAIEILQDEVTVIMGKYMLDKLKEVYEANKEKDSNEDAVETAELIGAIAEDPYFDKNMEQVVRENADGQKETLEQLLHRILKTHKADAKIQWHQFLGYFTKRGQLRESEKVNLQLQSTKQSENQYESDDANSQESDDLETKTYKLERQLK